MARHDSHANVMFCMTSRPSFHGERVVYSLTTMLSCIMTLFVAGVTNKPRQSAVLNGTAEIVMEMFALDTWDNHGTWPHDRPALRPAVNNCDPMPSVAECGKKEKNFHPENMFHAGNIDMLNKIFPHEELFMTERAYLFWSNNSNDGRIFISVGWIEFAAEC